MPRFLTGDQHVGPRKDHRAAAPRFTGQQRIVFVHHARGVHLGAARDERVGVDDDALPAVVPVHAQFKHGYAGVGREQHPPSSSPSSSSLAVSTAPQNSMLHMPLWVASWPWEEAGVGEVMVQCGDAAAHTGGLSLFAAAAGKPAHAHEQQAETGAARSKEAVHKHSVGPRQVHSPAGKPQDGPGSGTSRGLSGSGPSAGRKRCKPRVSIPTTTAPPQPRKVRSAVSCMMDSDSDLEPPTPPTPRASLPGAAVPQTPRKTMSAASMMDFDSGSSESDIGRAAPQPRLPTAHQTHGNITSQGQGASKIGYGSDSDSDGVGATTQPRLPAHTQATDPHSSTRRSGLGGFEQAGGGVGALAGAGSVQGVGGQGAGRSLHGLVGNALSQHSSSSGAAGNVPAVAAPPLVARVGQSLADRLKTISQQRY
ncbi:MAG: hypothetical protein WDW38_007581 [Sanguina aurantia]